MAINSKRVLNVLVPVISIALLVWAAPEILRHCEVDLNDNGPGDPKTSYIIQGGDLLAVAALVHHEGGEITHTLPIINAVGAQLTSDQFRSIRKSEMITRIYVDETAKTVAGSKT